MRLTYSPETRVAQKSITSRMLVDLGVNKPDFLPTIFASFQEEARLISILDAKGLKSKGLAQYGQTPDMLQNSRYRAVTSNHIQYRIEGEDLAKQYFRSNIDGVTFIDDANPTEPGKDGHGFYIFLDSNWIGGKEVILLSDQKTQLYVATDKGGEEVPGGVYRYYVKVWGSNRDEYVDPIYMQDGDECISIYNAHEQDFSKFGNEKYKINNQWGDAYLTLMRFKYSYSGTAQAMDKQGNKDVSGRWVYSDGDKSNPSFITSAQYEMMKEIASSLDWSMLEGKGTVSAETKKVNVTDDKGNEIMAGSGVLYSNDGPIEYPQNNGWSKKWIENFLTDIDQYVTPDQNGRREVIMNLPPRSYMQFQTLMTSLNITQNENIVGEGGEKVIVNTYSGYEIGGLRLNVTRDERLNKIPGKMFADGTKTSDYRCLVIPTGKTRMGNNGLEMVQLRPMVQGTVAGINEGGEVSSSIDGTSVHALTQTGIVSQIQPIIIYKPFTA